MMLSSFCSNTFDTLHTTRNPVSRDLLTLPRRGKVKQGMSEVGAVSDAGSGQREGGI
jgi:hypothetical protein